MRKLWKMRISTTMEKIRWWRIWILSGFSLVPISYSCWCASYNNNKNNKEKVLFFLCFAGVVEYFFFINFRIHQVYASFVINANLYESVTHKKGAEGAAISVECKSNVSSFTHYYRQYTFKGDILPTIKLMPSWWVIKIFGLCLAFDDDDPCCNLIHPFRSIPHSLTHSLTSLNNQINK